MKKIEWTINAKNEFNHTYNFWIEHNKSNLYSEKLLNETLKKVNLIAKNPKIGEENKRNETRRVLVLEIFSVIYKEEKSKIKVLSFFDNRRKPK